MGYKIIVTESCCDYVQKRKHKKKRINKKWLKRYGMKSIPYEGIIVTSPYGEKVIFCHPKYWDKFRMALEETGIYEV